MANGRSAKNGVNTAEKTPAGQTEQGARRNNVQFPCGNCASEPDHVGERRRQTDAGRFEVLLYEALLNPVQAQQESLMIFHKTLRNLVLGENHVDFPEAPTASSPPRPPATAGATQTQPEDQPACFLTKGRQTALHAAFELPVSIHNPCLRVHHDEQDRQGCLHDTATVANGIAVIVRYLCAGSVVVAAFKSVFLTHTKNTKIPKQRSLLLLRVFSWCNIELSVAENHGISDGRKRKNRRKVP